MSTDRQTTDDVCGICDGNGCPDCEELPDYDPIVLRAFATDTARVLRAAATEIERLRSLLQDQRGKGK